MKTTGSVLDFSAHAAVRAAATKPTKALNRAELFRLAARLPEIDRAVTLTNLARRWDEIAGVLSAGPGCLDAEQAQEALQLMASALVDPAAIPYLCMALPALREAVKHYDAVRDGDVHPADLDLSYGEALGEADVAVDNALWPLLRGLPLRDACRTCRNTASSVNHWQLQVGCAKHDLRAL